jgi:threonine aldolase
MEHFDFASDNTAPATPEAFEALAQANSEAHVPSYGADRYTAQAEELFSALFERQVKLFFVPTGTGANALAISALRKPFESVFAAPESHLERDETAAPEFFSHGLKLQLAGDSRGDKLSIAAMQHWLKLNRGVHSAQPRVISITQATELGALYSLEQLDAIHAFAAQHQLLIHMDGARFANAVAASGSTPAALTWQRGVDVLCFGGSKNGVGLSEAVVFFDPARAEDFAWRRKQGGQLASKMRWLSAPWLGALKHDHWLQRARHANAMAQLLRQGFIERGLELAVETQINGVFVRLGEQQAAALHLKRWHFYKFLEPDVYRFMCAWNTREDRIAALLDDLST